MNVPNPLKCLCLMACVFLVAGAADAQPGERRYPIVDTGQERCYDNSREISYPGKGRRLHGQDAQYEGNTPAYKDNGDGTGTDLNTGLMWSKAVDKRKVSLREATRIARTMTLGGHKDWRVPSIKELYSLIDFSGYTGFGGGGERLLEPRALVRSERVPVMVEKDELRVAPSEGEVRRADVAANLSRFGVSAHAEPEAPTALYRI